MKKILLFFVFLFLLVTPPKIAAQEAMPNLNVVGRGNDYLEISWPRVTAAFHYYIYYVDEAEAKKTNPKIQEKLINVVRESSAKEHKTKISGLTPGTAYLLWARWCGLHENKNSCFSNSDIIFESTNAGTPTDSCLNKGSVCGPTLGNCCSPSTCTTDTTKYAAGIAPLAAFVGICIRPNADPNASIANEKPTLYVKETSDTVAKLQWDGITNAETYTIFYKTTSDTAFSQSGSNRAEAMDLTGLSPQTEYQAYVQGVNKTGVSQNSNVEKFTTTLISSTANFCCTGGSKHNAQTKLCQSTADPTKTTALLCGNKTYCDDKTNTCKTLVPSPLPPPPPCLEGWAEFEKEKDKFSFDERNPLPTGATIRECTKAATAFGGISTKPEEFITRLFGIILGFSGGIALLLIIFSGYQMMMSQGNPEKIQGARETLTSAIVGLLFIIFSLVILEFIGLDILHIPGFRR